MKLAILFLIYIFKIELCLNKFSNSKVGISIKSEKFKESYRIKNINFKGSLSNDKKFLGPPKVELSKDSANYTISNNSTNTNSSQIEAKLQIIKKRILRQPVIIIPVPSPYCNEKWNYESHGDDWQCDCKEGQSQSPIDLPEISKAEKTLKKTIFSFYNHQKETTLAFEDFKVKIKGNLATIVTHDFIKYEMYEAVFHTKSDHSINGKFYDLELQIYYKAVTPGFIRKSAALSFLFKITPGTTNLFFDKDINILDLPDNLEKTKILKKQLNLENIFKRKEEDDFEGFSFFQYEGSLTSPPCQEEVTWFVISSPLPISYTTVEYFKDSMKSQEISKDCLNLDNDLTVLDSITENSRNIQELNCRTIYHYESYCNLRKNTDKPEKKPGHYERIQEEIKRYFYINDDKPSGLPGSFVVPEKEAKSVASFIPSFE
jgi:carbonic anhydrase